MADPLDIPPQPFAASLADPGGLPLTGPSPSFDAVPLPPSSFAQALADAQPPPLPDPALPLQDFPTAAEVAAGPAPQLPTFAEPEPAEVTQQRADDLQAARALRDQREAARGFTAVDSGDGDVITGGPVAAQGPSSRTQADGPTQFQAEALDLARQVMGQRGTPGDRGQGVRKVLETREQQSQADLQAANESSRELGARADVDRLLVEDAAVQQLELEAEQAAEIADVQASHVERVTDARDAAAVAKAGEAEELRAFRDKLMADTETLAAEQVRDRRTMGKKAIGTIAIALGGIGAAISNSFGGQGGRAQNTALATVNAQIERDIDNQIRSLGRRQTALAARGRSYDRLATLYSDSDARRQAAISLEKGDYRAELESIAARHAGTNKGEDAAQLALQLQAEESAGAEEAARLQTAALAQDVRGDREAREAEELARARRAGRGSRNRLGEKVTEAVALGGVKAGLAGDEGQSAEERRFESSLVAPGGTVPLPNAAGGEGPTNAQQVTKSAEIVSDFEKVNSVVEDMKSLAKIGTTWSKNSAIEWGRLVRENAALQSVAKGQGAMTDDERQDALDLAGDPTDINLRRSVMNGLQRQQRSLRRATSASLKPFNLALPGTSRGGSSGASAADLEATRK